MQNVPESYSSEVYKLTLAGGNTIYAKIPFNKDKLFREYRMLDRLKQVIPVPAVLDFWSGDETVTGALLLSEIQGVPCTGAIDGNLAFQIGVYHAKLHEVEMPGYGADVIDGFQHVDGNDWRLYIRNNFEKWKGPCGETLGATFVEKCIRYFEGALEALPEPDGPCLSIWIFSREIYK